MKNFIVIFFYVILSSCASDLIIIDVTDYDSIVVKDSIHSKPNYSLSFDADIDSKYNTKSVIPFPVNCYSNIYAYKSGESPLNYSFYTMQVYESKTLGDLSPTSHKMSLPAGEYDIYATASTKTNSTQGPNLYN